MVPSEVSGNGSGLWKLSPVGLGVTWPFAGSSASPSCVCCVLLARQALLCAHSTPSGAFPCSESLGPQALFATRHFLLQTRFSSCPAVPHSDARPAAFSPADVKAVIVLSRLRQLLSTPSLRSMADSTRARMHRGRPRPWAAVGVGLTPHWQLGAEPSHR